MPRPSPRVDADNRVGDRLEASGSTSEEASPHDSPGTMLIGEVAAATGLTQRTLRYYEEIGLLPQSARLEGGFRLYMEEDVARLRRITDLKRLLGFSLVEIKEMIEMDDERRERRTAYHQAASAAERRAHVSRSLEIARRQLAQLDSRLAGLLAMKEKTDQRIGRYLAELDRLAGDLDRDPADNPADTQPGQDAT